MTESDSQNTQEADHTSNITEPTTDRPTIISTGGIPPAPSNFLPMLIGTPDNTINVGEHYTFKPTARDSDGDTLTFTIENKPDWLTFDITNGTLSGIPLYTDVGYFETISIQVSDGKASDTLPAFSIEVKMNEVELAIVSGDASIVSSSAKLEQALINSIDAATTLNSEALIEIFNLESGGMPKPDGSSLLNLTWNPTHDAALLTSEAGENTNLLLTNSVFANGYSVKEHPLAILGNGSSRYMIFGGNPMRNAYRASDSLNTQMHTFLENSLAWLTDRVDLKTKPFNVVMAQLGQSYYFPDQVATRDWLDSHFPNQVTYNSAGDCDGAALASCISSDTKLLIVSSELRSENEFALIVDAVKAATLQGIPVLYLHKDGHKTELSTALLNLFDTRHANDNYWHKLEIDGYDATLKFQTPSVEMAAVRKMAENFRDENFTIDWSDCDGENCSGNVSLNDEFWIGAKFVQSQMQILDTNKINLFQVDNKYRIKKLMALLGDHYRKEASFPMDRIDTPNTMFLRNFYADHASYQYRDIVGTWGNAGNFSRINFSHITPTTRMINHVSKRQFRSTGAYALPGITINATRKDSSDVNVTVFVNTLRSGATHVFADNGYKRPRYPKGTAIPIEPGETIRFTSDLGGPIQLGYSTNDKPVEVIFDNIGEHPFWRSNNDDISFEAKMAAAEFDWAEIAAPSFEVHSTREKMVDSMANPMFGANGGTPKELVDATMRYMHNFPHVLAGFQGAGIDVIDEIHQFAINNNLQVHNLDTIKHMNADQATCGYGCSGNPYDAYWSFSPIGHGDIHELGHGLEKSRFRLTGWPGHSTTNYYSYYTKSQYYKDTGEDPSCQSLPFAGNLDVLKASRLDANPANYMQTNLWTNPSWSEGSAMIIQMMMAAEDLGALTDGWHLLARLHIIEREYQKAINDDALWATKRTGLGMEMYERLDAKAMGAEDWLLIAVSQATGRDFRNYFDTWGHSYSAQASAQVAAMGVGSFAFRYYTTSTTGYCKGEGFDGVWTSIDPP